MINVSLNGSYGNNYGNSYMEPVGYGASRAGNTSGREDIALPGAGNKQEKERKERLGIKDPTEECQTCKNRKYKDGSDEMVSFKSPAHISPESAASAVRSHEQEHVTNAYSKAATGNGKVLSATVSIQTSVCPECGRSYVSGGTTSTQIKYYNEDNPYQKDLKATDHDKYAGMNLDYAV
ncbi:MAG: hypothetical protein K2O97_04960 [Acetatifactor sp.]|nr:hypothetical protein [Acetatifactor sp.]